MRMVTNDDNLNEELDLKRHEILNSLHRNGIVFVSHFKDCSTEVKDHLFKTHFPNAYGCQLWTTYCTPVITRIPVHYNDVYRWLFKIRRWVSISGLFVSTGIDSFNVIRRKFIIYMFGSCTTLGQKYYAPQVRPNWGSNSWPPDHDSTFHVTERRLL